MRGKLGVVMFISAVAVASCSKSSEQPANVSGSQVASQSPAVATSSPVAQLGAAGSPNDAVSVKPKVDACALLTSDEVKAVQREATKETKLSGHATGGFNLSQCFYTLPTFTNSISLLVAHRGDGSDAHDPREFWRETFHENTGEERERERKRGKKLREEEEEGAPPEKVAGVGDEAYWTGSRIGGALYVLKGNSYVRISIGGPDDQASKMKKSKALAQKALARL